jgi:hypothetical protein
MSIEVFDQLRPIDQIDWKGPDKEGMITVFVERGDKFTRVEEEIDHVNGLNSVGVLEHVNWLEGLLRGGPLIIGVESNSPE